MRVASACAVLVAAFLSLAGPAAASHLINEPVPADKIVTTNGLEWVWASPCAQGGCSSTIRVGKDGFNYATQAQWALRPAISDFGIPGDSTLNGKCATPWFDVDFSHYGCDGNDPYYRDAQSPEGAYGSASVGGLPAGDSGTVPMGTFSETWLVRVASQPDADGDGVVDALDRCPGTAGGTAVAADGCPDPDRDGVSTPAGDNCPNDSNPDQADADRDRLGDVCDPDDDNDGVGDGVDRCPGTAGGTVVAGDGCPDPDSDGVSSQAGDNCPNASNPGQADADGDRVGDVCDPDDDNDGAGDDVDRCPGTARGTVVAADGCPDPDSDGVSTQAGDNCPTDANGDQADADRDRLGDACDPDDDNDGVADGGDSCTGTPAGTFVDTDGCDPCDSPAVITDTDNDKTIEGTEGDDVICGDADSEQVFGRGGNDRVYGRGGADSLNGGPGNDRIHGGAGNDTLLGFQGADTMLGGAGLQDLVRYGPLVTVPLTIDLSSANGATDGAAGEGDSVGEDVEQAMGGTKADRIGGNGAHNTLHGGAGDDRIFGRLGADAMYGEAGNDNLTGSDDGTTVDTLNCGANGGTANPGPGDTTTGCTIPVT